MALRLRLELGLGVGVRVRRWVMYYADESLHKVRSTGMCWCVFFLHLNMWIFNNRFNNAERIM